MPWRRPWRFKQRAQAYDDAAEMFIRQVRKIDNRAEERQQLSQAENVEQSTSLVRTLRDVVLAYGSKGSSDDRLNAIGALIQPGVDDIVHRCNEHIALATHNHLHLLPQFFQNARSVLMLLLEKLPWTSTTQDKSLEEAIRFVLAHKISRAETVPIITKTCGADGDERTEHLLKLSFIPEGW